MNDRISTIHILQQERRGIGNGNVESIWRINELPMVLSRVQHRRNSGYITVEQANHIEYVNQLVDRAAAMFRQEAPRSDIWPNVLLHRHSPPDIHVIHITNVSRVDQSPHLADCCPPALIKVDRVNHARRLSRVQHLLTIGCIQSQWLLAQHRAA